MLLGIVMSFQHVLGHVPDGNEDTGHTRYQTTCSGSGASFWELERYCLERADAHCYELGYPRVTKYTYEWEKRDRDYNYRSSYTISFFCT